MSVPMETIIDEPRAADTGILREAGFHWRDKDGVKIIVSDMLEAAGFINGFSTRMGGVSPFPQNALNLAGFKDDAAENIHENRRRFLAALGVDHRLALAFQVHGDEMLRVASPDEAEDSDTEADAIVSNASGVLAAVKTADCVPVLIGDPTNGAFAAVHAGWRGTVLEIVRTAVARLTREYGSNPGDMVAAIGPAASCRAYEVGPEVIDQFSRLSPENERYFTPTENGHAFVDLASANRDQLLTSGLAGENISVVPFCTMLRTDLFFSYRIEKKTYGNGRMLSVIGRR